MTEADVRAVAAAHAVLTKRAIALVRKYGAAISLDGHYGDFHPADEEGVALTIKEDVATLHYTSDDYDAYAAGIDFDARALWSRKAIADGIKRRRAAEREARAQRIAQQAERDRRQYEELRRRFEPANPPNLRADIRSAIEVCARLDGQQ